MLESSHLTEIAGLWLCGGCRLRLKRQICLRKRLQDCTLEHEFKAWNAFEEYIAVFHVNVDPLQGLQRHVEASAGSSDQTFKSCMLVSVQTLTNFVHQRKAFLFIFDYLVPNLSLLHLKVVDLPAELDHLAKVFDDRLH